MDILLLGIYSFFVWLVFIKFKWLPWNITSQVIVVTIPIIALTVMILTLNVVAPSSAKLRVFKYTIPIVSQVRGRVLEVPVEEGNRLVHKGDVLFKVDPTPYQLDVANLEAQLALAQGGQKETEESLTGANAKVAEARAAIATANARLTEVDAKVALARKRVEQYTELVKSGAADKFALEQAEANLAELTGQRESARSQQAAAQASEGQALASVGQIRQKLGTNVNGTYAQVAQIRAQLENARWLLRETTTVSPCECYVINLQLRPGAFVAGLPLNPVMSLVEADGQIIAFFAQNELTKVQPGDEAEFALETYPGQIVKGKVDSVIWAIGQGQVTPSGTIPMSTLANQPPGQFAVKFDLAERDRPLFLAAGASGDAAIYTQHAQFLHILRKVILRVGSYTNYLVLKLH
ncbi:MAG TPA: biotin/lipoyl-binding protein [Casimicrobiaceae bacterium]|nr:biotin/lipoyl-binding protein [Casimicrobiaceae bacterium]